MITTDYDTGFTEQVKDWIDTGRMQANKKGDHLTQVICNFLDILVEHSSCGLPYRAVAIDLMRENERLKNSAAADSFDYQAQISRLKNQAKGVDEQFDANCYYDTVERMRIFEKALKDISSQRKTYDKDFEDGDIDFAYNALIAVARSALERVENKKAS